jgi:serine/threonine protein kinase
MQMETLPAGTILHGRYRTERALGSGGFGHVYLSVDLKTNLQYAIKEYLVAGPSGKAQLEHEAQVLSQLHHPNLPAFQAAFYDENRYYVVLGYIEGNDLTDYIRVVRQKNEVIPPARLMGWILAICDAVNFLHSQHPPVIHRDIKPDNIRITSNGTAILVDLGNAKTAADGARTLFFIRHQGTPGYAPLEQYPGGIGTDERSDIYALGGTLYFALTAQEPPSVSVRNQAVQQKQQDLPTLADLLAHNPPDGPQEVRQFRLGVSKPAKPVPRHSRHLAQLATIPPEVLRGLDTVIQRAMAMKPQNRYQSIASFGRDLQAVLKALPASTPPAPINARQLDPHSTQPDLPMLYEAMQNAAQAQAATQNQPVQPAEQTPPAQTPGPRCPTCGLDLTRMAPFCPRCGTALQPPLANNIQKGQPGRTTDQNFSAAPKQKDIANEATMLIQPQISSQEYMDLIKQADSAAAAQAEAHFSPTATAAISPQQPRRTTTSQPVPSAPPQLNIQKTPASPHASGIQNNVKPFIATVSPASNEAAIPPSQPGPLPATKAGRDTPKKLLMSLAIVIVSLAIIMLLLLVFIHSQHPG